MKPSYFYQSLSWILGLGTLFVLPITTVQLMAFPPVAVAQSSQNSARSENQIQVIAEGITVKVISGESSGSGVIIKNQNQVYTVLTNQHVIEPNQPLQIQTNDGKIHPATLVNNIDFQGKDLTLIQFQANENYTVANLANLAAVKNKDSIYAAGYPYESEPNQPFVFTTGQVLYIPPKPFREGYQIGYNNDIQKGMSGGPILNVYGQVIGINGIHAEPLWGNPYIYEDGSKPTAAEQDLASRCSWGIPIETFAELAGNFAPTASLPQTRQTPIAPNNIVSPIANDVNNIAEKITVKIEWQNGNGSGVIVAKQGNTYYVLTAEHVVRNKLNFQVVTPDGKSYPVTVNETNVKTLPGVDLAVIQFISNEIYPVATLANYDFKNSGFIFAYGWPANQLTNTQTPDFFSAGNIFAQNYGDFQGQYSTSLSYGYELVYTNITASGMSGGPLLDNRGQLIGIHGRADGEIASEQVGQGGISIQLGYSLGIPIRSFLTQLQPLGIQPEWLKVQTGIPPAFTEAEINTIITAILKNVASPTHSQDIVAWLNYGNQLWRLGKNQEALNAFGQVVTLQPKSYLGWYGKGLTLYSMFQYTEALNAFDQAIQNSPPNFAPPWYWRGQALVQLKRYEDALAAIKKALEMDRKNFTFHFRRGYILAELLKRYQEAIVAYTEAININHHPFFYNNRGLAYSNLKNYQQAISDYNQAIQLNPNDAVAYSNRGNAYSNLKDYEKAISDFNQAIQLNPNDADVYTNRGNVYSDLKDYEKAISDFNQAIQLNPNLTEAYNNRGNVYSDLKNYEKAISDLNQAIQLNPNYAEAYNNRGIAYRNLEDYEKAISDFNQATQLNPNLAEIYNNRGNVYSDLKDYEKAISNFNQAIQLNPNYAEAYTSRGNVYYYLKDYEKAIYDYNQAIQLNPNDAEAYYNRGHVYANIGNEETAISDFQKSAQLYKQQEKTADYQDALNRIARLHNTNQTTESNSDPYLAYVQQGKTYYRLGNYTAAVNEFTQAININPNYFLAYNGRGNIYFMLKEYEKAISDYNKVLQLNPNFDAAYNNRGVAYFNLKNYQQAISDYNQAIQLNPNNADAYNNRGVAYFKLKNYQQAISDYNQAVIQNQDFWPAMINIGLIKYEMGEISVAIQQWQKAIEINNQAAEPLLALAVALYHQGEIEKALAMAEAALKLDHSFSQLEVLRENLWGDKLLADAEKLLKTPRIQAFLSQNR
ncbi:putative Tetratricopeptide repeat protein [Planktothrix serta PCC 8927]|uniref:Tetratricopeptide repeat protein n=1 Tax=Planktothrix serta PCC 8927 TaxID=671068 RepID=A0A7Z9BVU5_9CYAN|nr:serine protease [Planktothrix serta]VXD23696.1 putative Tetratricopeptide repeat protein [Planktothrix serta PCC 8927]